MVKKIALSRGLFALVDDVDYALVADRKWYASKGGKGFYAIGDAGRVQMHRVLTSAPDGFDVDHINGDGLDNRRINLRVCLHRENQRNRKKQSDTTSRFKGVSVTKNGRWQAGIEQNGVKLKLGIFVSEFEAARAYDRAARILFGQFAKTNAMLGLFDGVQDRVTAVKNRSYRVDPHFISEMRRIGVEPRLASARR